MPKPTTVQLFGTNAQVLTASAQVTASAQDPALVIRFSDFASVSWNTAAGTTDPEKWLAAMILRARNFYAANTDQVPAIDIQAPFPGLTTRNNALRREYNYQVLIYEPDNGNAAPDPDNVA